MRYIQIIRGAYGYRKEGSGITITKTPTDPPFEVSDAEAERLVKIKVAKYAEAPKGNADAQSHDDDGEQPLFNNGMKLAELQEIAKAYGVDASKMRKKDEVINAIEAAIAEADAAGTDDEPPEGDTDETENDNGDDENGEPNSDDEQPPNLGTANPEVTI